MPSPKKLSFWRYAYSRKKVGDMTTIKIKSEMCNSPVCFGPNGVRTGGVFLLSGVLVSGVQCTLFPENVLRNGKEKYKWTNGLFCC